MNRNHLCTAAISLGLLLSAHAWAGGPANELSAAGAYSARAVGHALAGSAELSAGVLAVPLTAGGELGRASAAAGDDLWRIANGRPPAPLPLTDRTVTVDPSPAEALGPGRRP